MYKFYIVSVNDIIINHLLLESIFFYHSLSFLFGATNSLSKVLRNQNFISKTFALFNKKYFFKSLLRNNLGNNKLFNSIFHY